MSSDWKQMTLGQLCDTQNGRIQTGPFGSQLHTTDYVEQGAPVVMPTNIIDSRISESGIARVGPRDVERLAQHKLNVGDIVFSRRGDVTKNALIRPNQIGWLCGTGCLKVRLGDESLASARFVSYYLQHPETLEWLVRHAVGATMPNLNTDILSRVPVSIPTLDAQSKIVAVLDGIGSSIETLQQQNICLEAIAQRVFRSWFVNFDPVHAKAAGKEPEAMSAELAELFPSEVENSELGPIPKDWRVVPYADVIDILSGGTPKTSVAEYWKGDIPWFSVTDAPVKGQVFILRTEKHITKAGLENSPAKLLPSHSTIISARGTVGKIGMVSGQMSINQSCYALSPKNRQDVYWVYFQTRNLVSTLKQMAHGGVFDTITRDTFRGVKVIVPPNAIFDAFSAAAKPLFNAIECNGRLMLSLTELRDHLLPRLISGKLSIGEAEKAVADLLPEPVEAV